MTIQDKFPDFTEAAKELDQLALEGFFGNTAKKLTLSRDTMERSQFYSACLDDWVSDTNQYGKPEVVKMIFVFLKLYIESIQKGGQKSIDALTHFMTGVPENPETECLSSFTEFLRLHTEVKIMISETKQTSFISDSAKKRLGGALTNSYSKGVELISKMLTTCITLLEISKGIQSNQLETYHLFLWKKIKRFNELSDGNYDEIVQAIDRDIRNAEAHLNIRFIPEKEVFKYKTREGKHLKSRKISVNEFILDKYPRIGWVIQGFMYSSFLLIIGSIDQKLCETKMRQIIGEA